MKILAVCGYPYSGKDTFYREVLKEEYELVSVSGIVKKLSSKADRTSLQDTGYLAQSIGLLLIKEVQGKGSCVMINGIRQKEILEVVIQAFPETQIVWLEAPSEVREKRFMLEKQSKDSSLSSYQELVAREDLLGLKDLKKYVDNLPHTTYDSSIDYVFTKL